MKVCIICSIFVIVACIPTINYQITYQEYAKPIFINETIGDVIDADERLNYGLFHGIDNFQEASIYEMPHGGYIARITTDEDEYIAVNGDKQGIAILRDYIERHDEIIANRLAFEEKWQIVAYDGLRQPITENEIKQARTAESCLFTYFTGGCVGTLLGALVGLIIGIYDAKENPGSIDIPNFAPIIGPIIGGLGGCVLGVGTSYLHTTKGYVINTIKNARRLRRSDK